MLIKKKITGGRLKYYFSITNLFKNLKEYQIVDDRVDDKTYAELVIAVRNEWNTIKNNI